MYIDPKSPDFERQMQQCLGRITFMAAITALSAEPDASPEPESEEQKLLERAQQLAQQPEVKAVFIPDVLAMTDGRWLRLCQLLAPGGDLAQRIEQKPKQINTYILVQVLCDEGWTQGLTPKDANKLGTALSGIIGTTTARDLTQRITKGKSTLLVKCGLDELPPAREWAKSGLPVETAQYFRELLSTTP